MRPVLRSLARQAASLALAVVLAGAIMLGAGSSSRPDAASAQLPNTLCTTGVDQNACLAVTSDAGKVALLPLLDLTLSGAPAEAIPGDELDYSVKLKNRASDLSLVGALKARNDASQEATIASYFVHVEYKRHSDGAWVPLAGSAAKLSGYTPQTAPQITTGMRLDATPNSAAGVGYPAGPGERIVGTTIASGGEASFGYTALSELTPAQIALLLDTAQVDSLRFVTHFETTRGTTISAKTRKVYFTKQLRSQTGELRDASIDVTVPDGSVAHFGSAQAPGLAELAPGAEQSVDASDSVPVPVEKGAQESNADYTARLELADGKQLEVGAEASGKSDGEASLTSADPLQGVELLDEIERCSLLETSDCVVAKAADQTRSATPQEDSTTERVPVLSLDKTGPETTGSGLSVTYEMALHNQGSATADDIELEDQVEQEQPQAVADAPGSLSADEEATAHVDYTVPADRRNGPLTDTGTLRWQDANDNDYGTVSDSHTTRVISSILDAPELDSTTTPSFGEQTDFLYSGDDPVQVGMADGTITETRAAVLRGRVLTREGEPLYQAKVSVADHPEYGHTLTRPDGQFYLAVNGGGTLTVRVEKDGYLPADRTIAEVAWRDYAFADDVALVPLDDEKTEIDLAEVGPELAVARGNPVSDDDGTRQATLLFAADTEAEMVLPNGDTEPLSELGVRATEFTVGQNGEEAMPAPLPPGTAYTYAAEFSVDEALAADAEEVRFSKPVVSYTDNFLGFGVGEAVPVGYYDRDKKAWLPEDDGRIVKLLSESSGMAELDLSGSGQPASAAQLAALGITDAERARLAELYAPGKSLWRVQVEHFTPFDINWSSLLPFRPLTELKGRGPETDDTKSCGSVIGCESQTLGEQVPVTGTPFNLHYQSERTPARKDGRTFEVPLASGLGPEYIELTVRVAGKQYRQVIDTNVLDPPDSVSFTWDGKDTFGRTVPGSVRASAIISYAYQRCDCYSRAAGGGASFGRGSDITLGSDTRGNVLVIQRLGQTLTNPDARLQGLGGWTLSPHHSYDPEAGVLYRGDGGRRSAGDQNRVIDTVAGGGTASLGDGGPATSALLSNTYDVAFAPDGSYYFIDDRHRRVRKVATDGTISTFAGSGPTGGTAQFSGDGGPATSAQFDTNIAALAAGPDGSVYISTRGQHRIRKVAPDGTISTFAGTGTSGFSGDGGPADQAKLSFPAGIAVAQDGSVYVADNVNDRIRRIGPDGVIQTVAGGGACCPAPNSDEGKQATAVGSICRPEDVAIGPDGSFYFSDRTKRVRRVDSGGSLRTVAGSGDCSSFSEGYTGDGGPATQAKMSAVEDIALDRDGSLYIRDAHRIRLVSPDGTISTFAGTGTSTYSGEDGPAAKASFAPEGMAVSPGGELYVGTRGNGRVVKLGRALPGFSGSEIAIPSEDGEELYRFDESGRHLQTVSTRTNASLFSFSYDSQGRLSKVTDGDGLETAIERDAADKPTAIVAPFGQRTALTTDANGWLASASNPANESFAMTTSADGLLASFTDPKGQSSEFAFDSDGRLTRDDDRADGYKTLSRTGTGDSYETTLATALGRTRKHKVERLGSGERRRTVTDHNGLQRQTREFRDGSKLLTLPDGSAGSAQEGPDPRFGMGSPFSKSLTATTPGGRQLSAQGSRQASLSDPNNPLSLTSLTETQTVNGRSHTSVFNASLRQYTLTTPANRTATTTVDAQGRPTNETLTGITPVATTYDPQGRPISVVQGARDESYSYDSKGRLDTVTDALDRVESFDYDDADRLTKQTLPDGREIDYGYDANGNLTSLTPPSRPAHGFAYSARDSTDSYTPPQLGSGPQPTQFSYNQDGELTKVDRPGSDEVSIGYDSAGRPDSITQARGQTTLAYSSSTGNLSSATAPGNEQTSFSFDGPLPTGETQSGSVSGEVTRSFDNDFRLASESVNGANTVGYSYDQDSLLTGAGQLSLTRSSQNGLLTGTMLGQMTATITNSAFGEPETVAHKHGTTDVYEETYARDGLGRIATESERRGATTTSYVYGFDQAGRLETVQKDGQPAASYVYDANGNRTQVSRDGQLVATADYDAQDRLTRYGSATFSYTAAGDLDTKTDGSDTTDFDYDELGALTHVELPDGSELAYAIDAAGRRIAKQRDGQLEQGFLYGRGLGPVAELNADGSIKSRFVYATRSNVPDYMTRAGNTYRIVTDQLGSPRAVIDASTGTVAQELDFDEFGRVTRDTNPGFQPFGYAGGLYDRDTKLVRFGARDYDPETGRFTTKDPIGFAGGDTNLYGYVLGDPVNFIDPPGTGVFGALSEAAAGAVDNLSLGLASKAFGVDRDCFGGAFKVGSFLGDLNPKGLIKAGVRTGIRSFAKHPPGDRLKHIKRDMYRRGAKIGDGSTADAIRYELRTGNKVGGKNHFEKGMIYRGGLRNVIRDPNATPEQKAEAFKELKKLQDAMSGL